MKDRELKARDRLSRLYRKWAGVYACAADHNRNEKHANCFRELAALYNRASQEIVRRVLWGKNQRGVDWRGVAYLLRESAK